MLTKLVVLPVGVAAGVLTGLVPGIHPNTVIFGSLPIYYSLPVGLETYLVFLAGMSVSHTFHDFLPAIYLGAPEAETALSALPGGDLASRGKAREAFLYTMYGGASSILFLLLLVAFMYLFPEKIEGAVSALVPYFVVFAMSFTVFNSDELGKSFTLALLSGVFGVLSFSSPVNQHYVLMPVFTGLFALPALYNAYMRESDLPVQERGSVDGGKAARGGILGAAAGVLTGLMPGMSPAVSATMLSPLIELDRKGFLAALGGVNTSDILFSLVAVNLFGQARTGASVAALSLSHVTGVRALELLGAGILASAVSLPLAARSSDLFLRAMESVDRRRLVLVVAAAVIGLNLLLAGPRSVPLLFTGSMIGYAAFRSGLRSNCMWVIMLPALLQHFPGAFI